MAITSQEFLDFALQNDPDLEIKLRELLIQKTREDLWLDYKDGNTPIEKGKKYIREFASAFSNAEGGVLIFGVENVSKAVNGCTFEAKDKLTTWAANCLTRMATQLIMKPRFYVFDINGVPVLLIAFARNDKLVYSHDGGQSYFLRFGDTNKLTPEYLLNDLLLGRRQRPSLAVRALTKRWIIRTPGNEFFEWSFRVDNVGMLTAREVHVGLMTNHTSTGESNIHADGHILSYIDNENPDRPVYRFSEHGLEALPPIGYTVIGFEIFMRPQTKNVRWMTALYLLPEGCPPSWFQLSGTLPVPMSGGLNGDMTDLTITPCGNTRPKVSWQELEWGASPRVNVLGQTSPTP